MFPSSAFTDTFPRGSPLLVETNQIPRGNRISASAKDDELGKHVKSLPKRLVKASSKTISLSLALSLSQQHRHMFPSSAFTDTFPCGSLSLVKTIQIPRGNRISASAKDGEVGKHLVFG